MIETLPEQKTAQLAINQLSVGCGDRNFRRSPIEWRFSEAEIGTVQKRAERGGISC